MGFKRLFGRLKPFSGDDVTEEEIISIVNEGHEQGVLEESEAEMINNIFALDDKEAQDIMTHRKNIVAVEGTMTLREMIGIIEQSGCSRYPVYLDDIDNIIGAIHIKDLLHVVCTGEYWETPISAIPHLIWPVPFIPETRNIDVLFKNMQSQKTHMVVVVDEYGQTAGLVTMEDILEEIVGNIFDEHDKEEKFILPQSDGSYLMDGMTELEEVCEFLHIEDEELLEDFDTLNGFIIARIDRIPVDGETFQISAYGYIFDVTKVENKMIRSVRVSAEPSKDLPDEP